MDKQKLEFVVAMAAKTTRDQLQAVTSELETRIMGAKSEKQNEV